MNYLYSKIEWYADFELNTPNRVAFAKHLKLVATALHDIEWVDSGDYSPGEEDESILAVIADRCGEVCERAQLCATCAGSLEEQEPVAWMWEQQASRSSTGIGGWDKKILFCNPADDPLVPKRNITPLYTHPPRQSWQSLTDEEIDIETAESHDSLMDFVYEHGTVSEGQQRFIRKIARAIEDKLKEKNV